MPVQAYSMMPNLREWKKDSAVGNLFSPRRRDDPVLRQIDRIVGALWKSKGAGPAQYLLGELFFTTMYWNNNHKRDARLDSRRRNPILSLNLCAANVLAHIHEVPVGALAPTLRGIYGTGMTAYGLEVDSRDANEGRYLSIAQREKYRVVFKGARAYRYDCLTSSPDPKAPLRVVNTKDYADFAARSSIDARTDTGAGFVMSMSRELYVGPFISIQSRNPQLRSTFASFHSSFMAGKPVMCAGMIEISNGVVTDIDNLSGHYKPVDVTLVQVLEQFRAIGMNLRRIKVTTMVKRMVEEFIVDKMVRQEKLVQVNTRGDRFLAANGNWEAVQRFGG
ncbi:MAG: hypothetical protein ABFS86_04930 [Planctomycetota bacterium]